MSFRSRVSSGTGGCGTEHEWLIWKGAGLTVAPELDVFKLESSGKEGSVESVRIGAVNGNGAWYSLGRGWRAWEC